VSTCTRKIDCSCEHCADAGHVETCCGQPTTWDPLYVGEACGGLMLRGGWVCATCGTAYLCRASRVADEGWTWSKGNMSINCGGYRIRLDGEKDGREAFLRRLMELPALEVRVLELERELATLKATP